MVLATLNTTNVSHIVAEELTPKAFEAFGGVISSTHQLTTAKAASANYGTAVKLFKVSPVQNMYSKAPSGKPGEANFNLFRCTPPNHLIKELIPSVSGKPEHKLEAAGTHEYTLKVLERHPYSTQTFTPMGVEKNQIAYMVVVAKNDSKGLPDPSTIRAFVARGNQAVTYGVATWHAPMIALNQTVDFAVLIHENGVEQEDCQEVYFDPMVKIAFHTEA